MNNRQTALQSEAAELEKRIESAILANDLHTYENLLRAQKQLDNRRFFARTAELKERVAALEDERLISLDLMQDFDSQLKQQAAVVIQKRGELMDAEAEYNLTKARQFALEGQQESLRVAINEAKSKLNSHVAALVNPFGNDDADGEQITETRYSNEQIIS